LGAIIVIAAFYTATINWLAFGGALVGLVIFALLQRFNVRGWYFYIPLGLAVWALMHASGIHATVAGVAMGLLLRTSARTGETEAPGERTEHLLRPISAGFAVPMFALFSAGVVLSASALKDMVSSPEPLAIVVGLVVGKTIGIFLGTYFAVKFTKAELNPDLAWEDVLSVAVLAGIGFTVSLLISGLAFDYPKLEEIKASVLLASVLAAGLASALIKRRNRVYRALCEAEANDSEASNGVKTVG
jgi:NhaA family Na+:H+ antiporter